MRLLAKRADGVLLIALVIVFLVLAIFPLLAFAAGLMTDEISRGQVRMAFLIMPLALAAEYIWFFSSVGNGAHSLFLCAILLVTSAIPFLKALKGVLP